MATLNEMCRELADLDTAIPAMAYAVKYENGDEATLSESEQRKSELEKLIRRERAAAAGAARVAAQRAAAEKAEREEAKRKAEVERIATEIKLREAIDGHIAGLVELFDKIDELGHNGSTHVAHLTIGRLRQLGYLGNVRWCADPKKGAGMLNGRTLAEAYRSQLSDEVLGDVCEAEIN